MDDSRSHDWQPCPPGEFARLATRLRARRLQRVLTRGAGAVALAALLVAAWVLLRSEREYTYAGISCSRVMQLADAYGNGELDESLRDQIRRHVRDCAHCRPLYKKMGLAARRSHPLRSWDENAHAARLRARAPAARAGIVRTGINLYPFDAGKAVRTTVVVY
jgi:hypothetical protein